MKALRGLLPVLFLFTSCSPLMAQADAQPDLKDAVKDVISGVWRGHSVCMVKSSPCRDEENVYRISAVHGKPNIYFVSGDKIVSGEEVVMGTGEWKYETATHVLEYVFPNGVFRLKVDGDKMEGDLKLPDGTLYRQIWLKRER